MAYSVDPVTARAGPLLKSGIPAWVADQDQGGCHASDHAKILSRKAMEDEVNEVIRV